MSFIGKGQDFLISPGLCSRVVVFGHDAATAHNLDPVRAELDLSAHRFANAVHTGRDNNNPGDSRPIGCNIVQVGMTAQW